MLNTALEVNKLTITEAAVQALEHTNQTMSLIEILEYININNLFQFKEGANAEHILRTQLNRKCINSNLSYKAQSLLFYLDNNKYGLLNNLSNEEKERYFDEDEYKDYKEQNIRQMEVQIEVLNKKYRTIDSAFSKLDDYLHNAEEAQASFLNTKKSYEEELKLHAAIQYWTNKRTTHKRLAIIFSISFSILLISAICSLLYLISIWSPSLLNTSDMQIKGNINLTHLGVIIFLTSIGIWLSRIILKIILSNLHLLEDAREKETMIETYLALIKEGGIGDSERNVIIHSIFRPSSNGMIKDDSHVTLVDILSIFKGNK